MARILYIAVSILAVGGVVFTIAERIFKKTWKQQNSSNAVNSKRNMISGSEKLNVDRKEDDLIAQWKAIYEKKGQLEQKMAMLVGGDTGMSILRMRIQRVKDEGGRQMYKENYLRKREKLDKLIQQYEELMRKAEKLQEIGGYYFKPIQDMDFYRELLNYRP